MSRSHGARARELKEAAQEFFDLLMAQKMRFAGVAARFGFTPQQAMTLFSLDPQSPIPMSAFAQRIRCEPSNVTGVIDKLEARGLVERRASQGDRRVKLLQVTTEGAR